MSARRSRQERDAKKAEREALRQQHAQAMTDALSRRAAGDASAYTRPTWGPYIDDVARTIATVDCPVCPAVAGAACREEDGAVHSLRAARLGA